MFPTTLSTTESLNMGYKTIGGYINSFFKQAKDSIALIFSSKLQDIFARGMQGAWSAHPKCQRRQVCKFYQYIQSVPVWMESWYVISKTGRKILEVRPRKNSLAVFTFHYLALHITPDRESCYMYLTWSHNLKPFSQSFIQFLRIYCNALEGICYFKKSVPLTR